MHDAHKLINRGPDSLCVGGLSLSGRVLLAPMAGVTDAAMRRIALRFGASAAVSEMIAAEGVARGDRETQIRLARSDHGGAPNVVQIAARDPESAQRAALAAVAAGADWVDVNMGCPCKRVTGGLAGSALMRDLDLAARIVEAVVVAIRVPVSVKMRLGWDASALNAPDLARQAEAAGAALVTVHGRTRQQFYTGQADWAAIAAVKRAVSIPVVANGDCDSGPAAREMLRLSGADAVMVGRAALGQPWLIGDIAEFLRSGRRRPPPPLRERGEIAIRHMESLVTAMGDVAGVRHARKHLAAYVDRAPVARGEEGAQLRRALLTASEPLEARKLIERIFASEPREAAA